MVTTPVEEATARRPSLGRKGAFGGRINNVRKYQLQATPNQICSQKLRPTLKTPYLSVTAGRLPASRRTPLQIPDEAFFMGQAIGQGRLGVRSAETEEDERKSTRCILKNKQGVNNTLERQNIDDSYIGINGQKDKNHGLIQDFILKIKRKAWAVIAQ